MIENLDVRVVVFSLRDEQLQVLLRPATEPDKWELPGCPLTQDISLDEAAARSIRHFTGLRDPYLEQLYTYGDAGRLDHGQRLISVAYIAILPVKAGAGASSALSKDEQAPQWFPAGSLPTLAGDHGDVISYALRRVRYKLEYTAIGFQLLPEAFSLSELQNVYEMILGERLDKRNFRRRILQAGIIEETSTLRAGEGRPARLYRYRPDAVAEIKARRLFP